MTDQVLYRTIQKQQDNTKFHLWSILYTESDPSGGWWFSSEDEGAQAPADEILGRLLLDALGDLAALSLGAHMVVVSCGVNLLLPEERKEIMKCLKQWVYRSSIFSSSTDFLN